MNKTLKNIVWVSLLGAGLFGAIVGLTKLERYLTHQNSIQQTSAVKVEAVGGYGSGVRISENNILTAWHVVEGQEVVQIRDSKGSPSKALVLWADEKADVALLLARPDDTVRIAPLVCSRPEWGQHIFHIGYPLGQNAGIYFGRVINDQANAEMPTGMWKDTVLISLGAAPGSSGGPIYNMSREVIGTVVGQFNEQHTMMIAVPGDRICKTIEEHKRAR